MSTEAINTSHVNHSGKDKNSPPIPLYMTKFGDIKMTNPQFEISKDCSFTERGIITI